MIRFENVTKVYARGAAPALDDVSLEIEREEFVFLVGKSGSGKSTFLQLVLREQRATVGSVWVLGRDLTHLSQWRVPKLRRQIGTVFQDFRQSRGDMANTLGDSDAMFGQQTANLVGLCGPCFDEPLPGTMDGQ